MQNQWVACVPGPEVFSQLLIVLRANVSVPPKQPGGGHLHKPHM